MADCDCMEGMPAYEKYAVTTLDVGYRVQCSVCGNTRELMRLDQQLEALHSIRTQYFTIKKIFEDMRDEEILPKLPKSTDIW